jgi:hypothetical protein
MNVDGYQGGQVPCYRGLGGLVKLLLEGQKEEKSIKSKVKDYGKR